MTVIDASALLAFLRNEPGSDVVEEALASQAYCSAANWAEVAQKVTSHGRNWELSRGLLDSFNVSVEPVTRADAEVAAKLWAQEQSLSLGDRLCIALSIRLEAVALTADRAWGTSERIKQIR